jgi:radical SAM superfamily enzyme YgiQ (UPF0313 family)
MKHTVVVCNFPRFSNEIWLPTLWASAKTYYEKFGQRKDNWHWSPCKLDIYDEQHIDTIKQLLLEVQPDVFAVSLYVWNYQISHQVAEWVKQTFPNCLIITGGPHQYFKHDANWFKKHWYIDASLPGESYGELCFQEILDNYENNTVDWNQVTDIRYPVGRSRMIASSPKHTTRSGKKLFEFNWSAWAEQQSEIQDFISYQQQHFPGSMMLGILETTRGCPYGCTYCDWGGGINTTVIKKDVSAVKRDIDALKTCYLDFLYISDANFGMFDNRDVEIVRYLTKKSFWSKQKFKIGYGGFAKTENKLDNIKQIMKLDFDNNLSHFKEIKISLQTLDPVVLKNMDRKNIGLDKQLTVLSPLAKNKKLPIYAEIILGLPGMTLDKFYSDLNVLGEKKLAANFYEWILLPEAPAYAHDYRTRFGIKTIAKSAGWANDEVNSQREVVVAGSEFSSDDYLQMLISSSLYHAVVQGGFYNHTMTWILNNCDIGVGSLIKIIIEEFFYQHASQHEFKNKLHADWQQVLNNPGVACYATGFGDQPVYMGWYFVALMFFKPQEFTEPLDNFLKIKYNVPLHEINKDQELAVNLQTFGNKKFKSWYVIDYNKDSTVHQQTFTTMLNYFRLFMHTGSILQARKKLFGLF